MHLIAAELSTTMLFGAWLCLVGRQHLPLLVFLLACSGIAVARIISLGWIDRHSSLACAMLGVAIGGLASLMALAVVICVQYGGTQLVSRLRNSLDVFPAASLGWLYGSIMFVVRKRSLSGISKPAARIGTARSDSAPAGCARTV